MENKEFINAMDRYGVDMAFLSNPLNPGGFYPSAENIDIMNKMAHEYVSGFSDRLKYLIYVNPALETAEDTVKRGIEFDGAIGIKLWVATRCDDASVDKLAELAKKYSVPVLIHTLYKYEGQLSDESRAENVLNIAKRHPDVKFIMAHLGGVSGRALKIIKNVSNVWTDISGIGFRNGDVEHAVKILGENRILFGTDIPGCSFSASIGKVNEAEISEIAKEKIFCKNAKTVYNLN